MASRNTRSLAQRMAGKALGAQLRTARFLDLGLAVALMRDARVPVKHKALAMGIGAAAMTGIVALEIPVEGLIAMAVPFLGGAADLAVDGAEETLGTLVLAALLLPRLAPRDVVERIRAERAGGA